MERSGNAPVIAAIAAIAASAAVWQKCSQIGCRWGAMEVFLAGVCGTQGSVWTLGCRRGALEVFLAGSAEPKAPGGWRNSGVVIWRCGMVAVISRRPCGELCGALLGPPRITARLLSAVPAGAAG